MTPTFFSRPVHVFGKVSILVICLVLFTVPFALRGARLSLQRMQNNVKDWLPDDFPETSQLRWFSQYFLGEQFILATWPNCTVTDPRYQLLVQKLQNELTPLKPELELAQAKAAAGDDPQQQAEAVERVRARQLGDTLGLLPTGDYHENWGGRQERWLQGRGGRWYFILPNGELHEWSGASTLPAFLWRSVQRLLRGGNTATGELVSTFGQAGTSDEMNEFYADPRKLGARLFQTLTTGPQVVEMLSKERGPLWPLGQEVAEEDKPAVARRLARERLTGILFGPALPEGFSWDAEAVLDQLPPAEQQLLPEDWQATLTAYVERLVSEEYGGDRSALINAGPLDQTHHWEVFFQRLAIEPPPRQTCLVLTLNDLGKQDLRRTIGRPMLGRPAGKLQQLAIGECGLDPDELKLGGPPVDNVAIDEEGTVTLFRLIGLSGLLGITLAWLCFRSFNLTLMMFFVGGLSAVASLAIVWWAGASVDAILMSMPSLVYVLGLSGAVHIVNYYQEAVTNRGLEGAPERALGHGWGPTTLCAFTTSLGLGSLCVSNLAPIQKFGFFSAISVLATLVLLFTFLPAALEAFPPKSARGGRRAASSAASFRKLLDPFWRVFGGFVVRRHRLVAAGCLLLGGIMALGLPRLDTSIQLLKLFDAEAKIIRDYAWLETNLGKLVPMELVVRVPPELLRPSLEELREADEATRAGARRQLSFLDRIQLVSRIEQAVLEEFGEHGQDIVGQSMSAATFMPELPRSGGNTLSATFRQTFNTVLESHRQELLDEDFLRVERGGRSGGELWRISLRLGALNDVDYGEFVHTQRLVVEPVVSAYESFQTLLRAVDAQDSAARPFARMRVGFLGASDPGAKRGHEVARGSAAASQTSQQRIDQTAIFTSTLKDLLSDWRFPAAVWHNAEATPLPADFATSEAWARQLASLDAVILVRDHPSYDLDFIRRHAKSVVDARDHVYRLEDIHAERSNGGLQVVYTGVVPVVYKAQRALLNSLISSITLSFGTVALTMMVLLRNWAGPLRFGTLLNIRAGLTSMLPNMYPVVIVFGAMGHLQILVDIGTMMCASVALGIAVDDTIHFLSWFGRNVKQGMSRAEAIVDTYRHVGTAMVQTTLIGGLGLSVFAVSTFAPTQRFGIMMVAVLGAALFGDLVLLPALLASRAGRYFCPLPCDDDLEEEEPAPASEGQEAPEGSGVADPYVASPHFPPELRWPRRASDASLRRQQ